MRIAIFTETFLPKVDGVVSILCQALERLNEKGHEVILFGPPGGPKEYAGAEIVGVGGPRLPFYPELRINIPRQWVWERVKAFQPDLIHVVNPFFLGPFGMSYAKRLEAPVVASFHTDIARYAHHYGGGFLEPLIWSYLRTLHNNASLNLCPSSTILRDLRAQGFRRVRWWQRGVDLARFTPGPRDEAVRKLLTNGNPDDFLVVYVGRHSPEKRLETIRDTLFQTPGVRLALVGQGPSHDKLKEYFAGTPTVFPGFMSGDDLVAAYRAADVFLFPSTTETFGLVALEAMACGAPVIAARAGGVLDIVNDGVNGLYFDPEHPEQIGPLVRQLHANRSFRDQLAANALSHAHSRPWQTTMDQLIGYYRLAMRCFRQAGAIGVAA
ncbi:MAG: glycosyltransferase family 1 protein [Chloroflexi bacterium]|nr:MAG: glycosyltransferase family 1 protein [Chloroflexota bacterium]